MEIRHFCQAMLGLVVLGIAAALPPGVLRAGPVGARADDDPVVAAKPLDIVTLEGGNKVKGRIIVEGPNGVTLEIVGRSGGTSRVTLPNTRIRKIDYGAGKRPDGAERPVGTAPAREDWFLLESDGRVVGTRTLTLRGVGKQGTTGWRLEEELQYFAQGPHVPALTIRRVEQTDLKFVLRESLYQATGRQAQAAAGPEAFVRNVAGRWAEGVWRVSTRIGTQTTVNELLLPSSTRGLLGHREHILRAKRAVGMAEVHLLDGATGQVVAVRTGFVGLGQRPRTAPGAPPAPPRDELHWETRSARLISWFGRDLDVVRETVAEGVVAVPVSQAQVLAALKNAANRSQNPKDGRVALARGGIAFELPDPSWRWIPERVTRPGSPWQVLGLVEAPVYTANVRVEFHATGARAAPGMVTGAAWLKDRLASVCRDLRQAQEPQPLQGVPGGWRVGYTGTLRGQVIHTLAVVVDRGAQRTVLLVACPRAAWAQAKPALERFIASVNLL